MISPTQRQFAETCEECQFRIRMHNVEKALAKEIASREETYLF